LLTLVDDALPAPVFRRVLRGVQAVGAAARYDRTFWHPLNEAPSNVVEDAIAPLAPIILRRGTKLAGVEWWIGRMFTTRVPLDFHHDRDLKLYDTTGRVRHPIYSSVLFLNAAPGGSLAVTHQRLVRRKGAFVLSPSEARQFETVRPQANRFAIFGGNLFHGVLDANDETPHGTLPGPTGSPRLTVVINWWDRRPTGVPRWNESRAYRALAHST